MPFKAEYLTSDLVLPYAGREYHVKPPTKENGQKLAALHAYGLLAYAESQGDKCPNCGRPREDIDLPEETKALIERMAANGETLEDIALGADVAAQMEADGVPAAHTADMAFYALYYWLFGEELADKIMEARAAGGGVGKALVTSASSTSKRGPRMESASQTRRRASTRATAASPTS